MNMIIKPALTNLDSYVNKKISYFLLPLKDFSVESILFFSLDEIKAILNKYPNIHIFVSINKNIMNDDIDSLKEVLKKLDKLKIDGVFYYDISLVQLKKELNLSFDLVWDQSHMVTNYKTCDYYYKQGVKYALLSKEITKDEIIQIIEKSDITSIVEVLSYPSVAFSKRRLVTNYYHDLSKSGENTLTVLEKVSNQEYFVNEEVNGTNFIKKSFVHGTTALYDLVKSGLSYVLFREDFIDHEFFLKILDNFSYFFDNYLDMTDEDKKKWEEEQIKLLGEDFGFFFQKTIYKVKK